MGPVGRLSALSRLCQEDLEYLLGKNFSGPCSDGLVLGLMKPVTNIILERRSTFMCQYSGESKCEVHRCSPRSVMTGF